MTGISFNLPDDDAAPAPVLPAADDVPCDGWWPGVNLGALRDAVRVPSGETERLRDAVRQAMLDIAGELAAWRADQVAAGYAKLADVPGRIVVDGKSDYELRWFRAVYSVVAADVGERAVGPQLSSAGADRLEALRADVDVHLRNVAFAVRDFLGKPRIVAEAL
ncbi:head completion/stabilization protein [Brevundimonas intermedia]|nr:head completion/stabilization protein [Brevundimonas intermedia]